MNGLVIRRVGGATYYNGESYVSKGPRLEADDTAIEFSSKTHSCVLLLTGNIA